MFNGYVSAGDCYEFEVGVFKVTAWLEDDYDSDIDDDDSHNVDQSVTGCDDNQQRALLAAREAYANAEWSYFTICLKVELDDIELSREYLGGVEGNYPGSDNSYLNAQVREMTPEAITNAKLKLIELLKLITLNA